MNQHDSRTLIISRSAGGCLVLFTKHYIGDMARGCQKPPWRALCYAWLDLSLVTACFLLSLWSQKRGSW